MFLRFVYVITAYVYTSSHVVSGDLELDSAVLLPHDVVWYLRYLLYPHHRLIMLEYWSVKLYHFDFMLSPFKYC